MKIINWLNLLLLFSFLGLPKNIVAQEVVELTCINGNNPLKQIGVYFIKEGKPELISEYRMHGDNKAFFKFIPPYEGFYVLGDTFNYMIPFYLKGGEKLELYMDSNSYQLKGKQSKENKILFEWLNLAYEIELDAVWFIREFKNTDYTTFFPLYDDFFSKALAFKESIHTKDEIFKEKMSYFIDYSLDYYMYSFIYSPRMKHPSYEEKVQYMDKLQDTNYFNKEYLNLFHFGERLKEFQGNYFYDIELQKRMQTGGNLKNGDMAEDFSYTDREGNMVSLSQFKGKLVLIDIWASWCGPCRQQFPHLKKLEEEFEGKDIVFIGISVDEKKAYKNWIKALEEHELNGIQLATQEGWKGKLIDDYGIMHVPTFILIDREGKIINKDTPKASDPALWDLIEEELDKK